MTTGYDWLEWARKAGGQYRLSSREALLLLYLGTRADPAGSCYPTEKKIREDLGWSNDTLSKAKQALKAQGLLTWDPKGYVRGRGRPSCMYWLRPQAMAPTEVSARPEASARAEQSRARLALVSTRAEERASARMDSYRSGRADTDCTARAERELQETASRELHENRHAHAHAPSAPAGAPTNTDLEAMAAAGSTSARAMLEQRRIEEAAA